MKHHLIQKQSGQTTLIISMILSLIMGCIVVGFTMVTTSGSQENVSSQQSNQAYYAAQSGVNDAIQAVQEGLTIPPIGSQNCSTIITEMQKPAYNFENQLNANPPIAYNCLYIQTSPSNLQFPVSQAQSAVIMLDPSAPTKSLTFNWLPSSSGGSFNVSSCSQASLQFVPTSVWNCPFPILRLDLYNYNINDTSAANIANDTEDTALANDTDTFFLFPVNNGVGTANNIAFDTVVNGVVQNQPVVLAAKCDSGACQETLNFPAGSPFTKGYARLTSIYADTPNVTISGDPTVTFGNSQLEIDSTGDDQNVIQRIQVRVPLTTTVGSAPNYAVDGGVAMCKHYTLSGPGTSPNPDLSLGFSFPLCSDVRKPAIYLYPTKTEVVNVKLSYPTGFKRTIPSYDPVTGWTVLAHPDGALTNLADGKAYPYLFWEGNLNSLNFNMDQGFVVTGANSGAFLNHELPIIGLNKSETAAFLKYWLPLIDHNKYNLIHFAGSEYTDLAPLDITPAPNSVLRVLMAVEPINMPVIVTPQSFTTFHRIGFTVVEWGGTIFNQ